MVRTIGLITLAAALALTGGCNKKATGQVVAVVNGEEISQQELNAEIPPNLPANADKKAVQAQVLQNLIDRKLLVQTAVKSGLNKTPEYVLQSRRGDDNLLVQLMASKAAKLVNVPDQQAVSQFMTSHPTVFADRKVYQLDQVAFPAPKDPAVIRDLGPINTWDGVIAHLTAAGIELKHGKSALDTASIPPEVAGKIAALKPGEPFVVPVPGGFVVNVVRAVEPVPLPSDATAKAADVLRRQKVEESLKGQVKTARATAKIDYQAGFQPPATAKPAVK